MSCSILRQLQEKIECRLAANELLTELQINPHSRLKGAIESDIEAALARLGLAVLVFTPEPGSSKPNVPGPEFDKSEITIRVLENPAINEKEATAYELVEEILRSLHHFNAGVSNVGTLYASPDRPVVDVSPADTAERFFDVTFNFRFNASIT